MDIPGNHYSITVYFLSDIQLQELSSDWFRLLGAWAGTEGGDKCWVIKIEYGKDRWEKEDCDNFHTFICKK